MLAPLLILAAVIGSSVSEPSCELPPIEEPHKHLVTNLKAILNYAIKEGIEIGTELITKVLEFKDKDLKNKPDKQKKFGEALQKIFDSIELNLGKLPKILQLTLALVKQILDCVDIPEIAEIVTKYVKDIKNCVEIFINAIPQAENDAVQIVLDLGKELDLDSCTNIYCKIERLSKLPEIIENVKVVKRILALTGSVLLKSFDATACGLFKTTVVAIKSIDGVKCLAGIEQETTITNVRSVGNKVKKIVDMIKEIVDILKTEVTNGVSDMIGSLDFWEKTALTFKLAPVGIRAAALKNDVTKKAKETLSMYEIDLENVLIVYACRIEDIYYDIFGNLKIIPVVFINAVDLIFKAISCRKNIICLLRVATNIPALLVHAQRSYVSVKMVIFNILMLTKQTIQAVIDAIVVTLS